MNSLAVAAPDWGQESAPLFDPEMRPLAEIYKWLTSAGLRGANAEALFDGYCQRLVWAGVRLLRGHVSTRTLHPQWQGYGFTWRRETNAMHVQMFAHNGAPSEVWLTSPFFHLIERARAGEFDAQIRRRLEEGPEQRDFPALVEFHAEGATDYFAAINTFGEMRRSRARRGRRDSRSPPTRRAVSPMSKSNLFRRRCLDWRSR